MSLGPGNRGYPSRLPCAKQSYSRIMRGPDCFEHSYPCPLLITFRTYVRRRAKYGHPPEGKSMTRPITDTYRPRG
jgi:hypothetical protein